MLTDVQTARYNSNLLGRSLEEAKEKLLSMPENDADKKGFLETFEKATAAWAAEGYLPFLRPVHLTDTQLVRYMRSFMDLPFEETEKAIVALPDDDPDKESFYEAFTEAVFNTSCNGFLRYTDPEGLELLRRALARYLKNHDDPFFSAVFAFLQGKKKECVDRLTDLFKRLGSDEAPFSESDFVCFVLVPFKNAFPGFYPAVRKVLDTVHAGEDVKLLCEAMEAYYATEDPDCMAEALVPLLQKYPDSVAGNVLSGYAYFLAKRWGNAAACFEKTEEEGLYPLFFDDHICFCQAVCYEKLRDHKNAVAAYEKGLTMVPDDPFFLNGAGYQYYLLKQYDRAEACFLRCIEQDADRENAECIGYAAGNYVRVLLATGRYADAKAFVAETEHHIPADLRKKVAGAANRNLKKSPSAAASAPKDDGVPEAAVFRGKERPREQFSAERILEDELELRMQAGSLVFGKKLKIYRRRGEYGRQYAIPGGRIDILAEDENGDLYVIELKKDSGYSDVYVQTAEYVDWLERHPKKKGQRIFGVICLNAPTGDLIEKVRADKRMRLFQYAISYEEVK